MIARRGAVLALAFVASNPSLGIAATAAATPTSATAIATIPAEAAATQTTAWPPPPEVLGRMRDLQTVIANPASSKEERAGARAELERLMKAPGAASRKPTDARPPARAAIDPFPSVVRPIEGKLPSPPTARLEVIQDTPLPRPAINPSTGSVIQPSAPGVAVDPRTGHLLHETPAGYIDPRSGRFVPK